MSGELKRVLTARAIAILTVGTVIGSGIFLVPSAVLRYSGGSVTLATGVWVVGGLLSLLGAITYAELGAMNPGAGGLYLYIRDAFGRAPAFAYGWTLFLVIGSGTVATLAVASTTYLSGWIPMSPLTQKVTAVGLAAFVSAINVFGTARSTTILNIGTVFKLGAILLLVIALPLFGTGSGTAAAAVAAAPVATIGTAGLALVSVLWAYEGWQYLTFMAGEVVEPQKNFPKGLALGTFALIVIYVAAASAYVAGIGTVAVMGSSRVAADAAATVLGRSWGKLITIPIIVSMLTAAQANAMMSARVYFAMARDGVFFEPMGRLHDKYQTPAVAVLSTAVMAGILAATGTFEVLLQYVVFVGWIFYALGGLAVIALRRRLPNAPRPYRVPGYPWAPILFVLSGLAIVVNTVVQEPTKGVIGLGAVALAIPAYYLWQRLKANR
ncbi:MAG: APC family permease [Gemmatimonadales bacterium]